MFFIVTWKIQDGVKNRWKSRPMYKNENDPEKSKYVTVENKKNKK